MPAWPGLAARLEGGLVVVEPLARGHGPGLLAAAADPAVRRWLPWDFAASGESFDIWLEDALARGRNGDEAPFAVLGRETGAPIGSTRYLSLRPEHRGLEIGWTWLARDAWGTGANTEAKLLLLAHAFESLGCMRVEFKTNARNERARAALAALPARFEGVFRKHMLVHDGDVRDSAWYAITDDEWPEVRAALEARVAASAERAA